jgi:hypothetical protein
VTITVNAPNGAVVNFPDGTATDTIKSVMAKNFGGPSKDEGPSFASGLVRSFSRGVPILGGLLNKADAASDAALAPAMNHFFPEGEQLKGDFGQRYGQALNTQEGEDKAFGEAHPIASTAAEIAGGVGSLGAAAGTGLGARALGLTAKTCLAWSRRDRRAAWQLALPIPPREVGIRPRVRSMALRAARRGRLSEGP